MAVRRSTASTSERRAGTSGFPARSTRRNRIPCPAGAGRNATSVRAPVCSPVPETAAFFRIPRLPPCAISPPYQRLQVVHDLREAVQGTLGPQELTVVAGRVAGHRGPRIDIADDAALHGHSRTLSDRHVVRQPRLPREEHVVLDVRAPRDARLPGDQTTRPDPAVMTDLYQVVDLRPGPDDGVVHAAPVDRGVRSDFHVVADDTATHLRDLAGQLSAFSRHVAETVRAEAHAGVEDHPIPHDGSAVADDLRVELHIVAHHDAVSQNRPRTDTDVAPQARSLTKYRVRSEERRVGKECRSRWSACS